MIKSKYEKENNKRPKRILALIVFILVILVLSFILISDWVQSTALFSVKTIQVKGNIGISDEEIVGHSGIKLGLNLFALDTDSCRVRIEELPKVGTVKLTKRFPDKIVIDVIERKPIAIVISDSLYYIDEQAFVWRKKQKENTDLPFISGISEDSIFVGKKLKIANIDKIIDLINIAKSDGIISEIVADTPDDIIFYTLENGYKVHLGVNDFTKKLGYLREVLSELKDTQKKIKYIDLRFENEAIVKF